MGPVHCGVSDFSFTRASLDVTQEKQGAPLHCQGRLGPAGPEKTTVRVSDAAKTALQSVFILSLVFSASSAIFSK